MRLAFTNLACPEWSIERAAEAGASYGYEGIEVRLLDGEVLDPELDPSARARVRDAADAAGLTVVCVDTSIRVAQPSASMAADGEAFARMASEWGASFLRVFGGDPKLGLDAAGRALAIEQLGSLAEAARPFGVTVLLETHDLFAASAPVADVLAAVDHPNAGALWDTLHPWRVGETPERTLANLGEWLRLVHVKDGVRRQDGTADLRILGEGDVPMAEVLAGLRRVGYDGWLSVEWERKWHPEIAPADVALPRHVAALGELGVSAR